MPTDDDKHGRRPPMRRPWIGAVRRVRAPRAEPRPPAPLWRLLLAAAVAVGLVAAGGWLAAKGLGDRALAADSAGWPTARGVVLASGLDSTRRRVGGRRETVYEPRVAYAYAVGGEDYLGERVRAGGYAFDDYADAQSFLQRYAFGAFVDVRYDPDDPGRSVLVPGGGDDWWLYAGFGAALILGGVGVGYAAAREWRAGRAARTAGRPAACVRGSIPRMGDYGNRLLPAVCDGPTATP